MTRGRPTGSPGIVPWHPVAEDDFEPGEYNIRDPRHMREDPDDPGTYIVAGSIQEDPTDPGIYQIGPA